MTDGTTLSVSPVHLPLVHTHIYSSTLAALTSDPIVLAKLERNPSFTSTILSNSFLVEEISQNHALLNMLANNPALLSAVISDPRMLTAIKGNTAIMEEVLRNPAQSIETILQNISKRNELIKPEKDMKNTSEKKPAQPQVLHKSEKLITGSNKIRSAVNEAIAKVDFKGEKASPNIPVIKNVEGKAQAKIPLIQKQSASIYIDPKTLAMHPSLVALLGAIAFSASRTKIITASGNSEELETQSERQLDTLQEVGPVHEVEEANEIHLMKETIA